MDITDPMLLLGKSYLLERHAEVRIILGKVSEIFEFWIDGGCKSVSSTYEELREKVNDFFDRCQAEAAGQVFTPKLTSEEWS